MQEQRTQTRSTEQRSGAPGNDLFDDLGALPAGAGVATVVHGTYAEPLPVAQMTIAEVRRRFADLLDIHPQANAVLDGTPVDDDTTVAAGQTLMFLRRSGEKGVRT